MTALIFIVCCIVGTTIYFKAVKPFLNLQTYLEFNMFKSITAFVTNAVTKYKAQRVRDVVSQYCATVDQQVLSTMPVAVEFYRGVVQGHRGLDDGRQ